MLPEDSLVITTIEAELAKRVVRIVHVPTEEQEDARRMSRERDRLVKERTAHVNG